MSVATGLSFAQQAALPEITRSFLHEEDEGRMNFFCKQAN